MAPEHIFDAGLGELFVVRIAGNVLNDDALASIEYAASHAGAPLLVVMGHTHCATMAAAAEHPEGQPLTPNMHALLARLEPSVEKARAGGTSGRDLVELATRGHVLRTIAEVRSRSTMLRELETQGHFAMVPSIYDLASGDVTWLEDAPQAAAPVDLPPMPAAPAGETAPVAAEPQTSPAELEIPHVVEPPPVAAAPEQPAPAEAKSAPAPEPEPEFDALAAALRDPIVVVGTSCVATLLLAALVTLLKK
jgi:carbonic anhydrase